MTVSKCVCCGRNWPTSPNTRVESGPIHFSCWDEHHSDPYTEWPVGHVCAAEKR